MKTSNNNLGFNNKMAGFTILEIIFVLALVVIISSISVNVYFNLKEKYAIQKDADSIVSTIEKTRNMSLNRKNDSSYGVLFASSTVKAFSGNTHATGNDILKYDLDPIVQISSISLTASSTEIDFLKTSGTPSATGTIVLKTSSRSKTITISGTGLVEVK